MLRSELSNIQIEQLVQDRKLSVRAMNVCRNGKLYTLEDLVTFYENTGTFINLRNSGLKSELELRDFCDSVIGSLDSYKTPDEGGINNEVEVIKKLDDEDIKINKWKCFFECLSDNKKTLYGLIYHNAIQTLNVRSANSISKFNSNEFFYEVFCIRHFSFQSLQYIGKSSIVYLNLFKSRIENELIRISLLSETDCFLEIYKHKFGYLDTDGFVKIFFESNGHLPLFWVLEKQLKSNTDREIEILRKSFNIFKKEKNYSLSEIASQLNNISKERVRQLRNKSFDEFFSCDSIYLKNTEDWLYYRNIVNLDVISLNSKEIIVDIIRNEQTEFTPIFIIQLFSILFSTEFVLWGGLEYVTNEQPNKKVTLLINRELYGIFDFEKFRDDIQELIDLQRYEEYILNFEEYLLNCLSWRVYCLDKLDSIKDVTSEILLNEFRLYTDIDGNIVIPANSERHPTLIVYEILKKYGSPMHINDIFVEFKKNLPNHKYINPEQLRPHIGKKKEAITFINRSSTYALIEWDHIKTGTIRDSIVEFLMLNTAPQPDNEIANYVLEFFPCSNISSIRTTMYNDTKKRFIYFKGGLFGLRNKRYSTQYEEVEKEDIQKRSFEERLYDFEKFIIENDHFPFSCSSNKNEEKLNRWWGLVINGKKSLAQSQINEIERIKIQYKDYVTDKNTFIWNNNYNKFKCFLIENHRLPYASTDEKFLYGWWRRICSDYSENILSEEQNMKYIELCKLI